MTMRTDPQAADAVVPPLDEVIAPDATPEVPAEPTAEATPEPTLADLQTQLADMKTSLEKSEQGRKTAEGRLKSGPTAEMESVNGRIDHLTKIIEVSTNPNLTSDEREAHINQANSAVAQAAQAKLDQGLRDDLATHMNSKLAAAGLTIDDPRVADVRAMWGNGSGPTNNLVQASILLDSVLSGESGAAIETARAAGKAEAMEAERKRRIDAGELELDTGVSGAGAGMSDQVWLDQYAAQDTSGNPLIESTPENIKKADVLFEKGLRPRTIAS